MVKESLAFTKYSALHDLEVGHSVDLGQAYKTKDSVKLFSHYNTNHFCFLLHLELAHAS